MKKVFTEKITSLDGTVFAVPSKSYFHRMAILSYLTGGDFSSWIPLEKLSEDERATVDCLHALQSGKKDLFPKQSATTLRFLLPIVCMLGKECVFHTEGKLAERNHLPLLEELVRNGAVIATDGKDISVSGKWKGTEFFIRGDGSSQFVSGLLTACRKGGRIHLTSSLVSSPYVDMTIDAMGRFGIGVKKEDDGFSIASGQPSQQPKGKTIEGDWSNAAFYFCLAALSGRIKVRGLSCDSYQGDKRIIELLRQSGAEVCTSDECITVTQKKNFAIEYDASDTPDLVPVLAAYCAFCQGKSLLKNVRRLRDKESDRLEGIRAMLAAAGIVSEYDGEDLSVFGGNPIGGDFDGRHDHRMIMACTLTALLTGNSTVNNIEGIEKSYPSFFEDVKKLCGGGV